MINNMGKTSKQNLVINDLLSFLVCKIKCTAKEKLLNCISNYYSKVNIAEAQKALLASLPVKKSTRHGRRVKHPDTLGAIYDCIQLIPEEDLPVFVCRDLNNVPHLSTGKTVIKEREIHNEGDCTDNSEGKKQEVEDEEMDEDLCRREQKQMKLQINEMMSIITELKDGLQKFTEEQNLFTKGTTKSIKKELERTDDPEDRIIGNLSITKEKKEEGREVEKLLVINHDEPDKSSEEKSQLIGLALIQKLIDEDDENNKLNLMEQGGLSSRPSDSEEDVSYMDEFCGIEDFIEGRRNREVDSFKQRFPSDQKFGGKLASKKPVVVVAPTITGKKIIFIRSSDDPLSVENDDDDDEPSFKPHEETIEISSENYLSHIEEIDGSSRISPGSLNQDDSEGEYSHAQEETKYDLRACAPEKCPICNITFVSKLDYDLHAKTHYTKGTYDCALCNQGFTSRDELVDHFVQCFRAIKQHCNLDEYTCPTCASFYADQTSLTKHRSFHSECRLFPCTHCSFRYFTNNALRLHIRNQHNPMNKYQCPLCDLSFLCNSYLLTHIAIHTGARPFICNVCDHKADTKKAIKQHIHTHGENQSKKFKCKECNYTCSGKYILLKHRLMEHREPVRCSLCEKTFKNPSAYKRHYDIHRGNRSFKCAVCLYSTPFKRYLDKHMLTHPASTKFVCPKCGVPLSSKHTVGHHLRSYCRNS